jgi:hypothetical protein
MEKHWMKPRTKKKLPKKAWTTKRKKEEVDNKNAQEEDKQTTNMKTKSE